MKIKKIYKVLLFVFFGIMAMPAIGYVLLQTSKFQSIIIQKLTSELSESLKTKITFNKANVGLFNKLVLTDFYIEDLDGDTLLYAKKLTAGIKKFSQKNRILDIQRIRLEGSKINLRTNNNVVNLKFIVDEIKKNSKNKPKEERLKVSINNISIVDSYFSYQKDIKKSKNRSVNFTDLSLDKFQLDVSSLAINNGNVNFKIKSLSFLEKSGFGLQNLSAIMDIGRDHMYFDDLSLSTKESGLKGGMVHFVFKSFKDFNKEKLYDSVALNIKLIEGDFYSGDIAYFSPGFYSLNEQVRIFGNISGKLNNLKGKNIILSVGKESYIACNFSINGLPDINTTFLHLNIDNLITTTNAIENIYTNVSNDEIQPLAKEIRDLGRIKFNGSFTGFIDDFVTYGTFNTSLGVVITDLLFRPVGNRFVEYSGKLSTSEFMLGGIIPKSKGKIGAITIDGDIKGRSGPGSKIDATLNTKISKLELNDYAYKNIRISGVWNDTYFNGDVNVNDPNLEMDFSGKIDYSDDLAEFNFKTNVTEANLYNLNIDKSDSASFASFILSAKGTGKNLDDFNGEIKLVQSYFEKSNKQIQLYDVSLISENTIDSSRISLKSDFVDVNLEGRYEFKYLKESLKQLINFYLPSIYSDIDATKILAENSFYIDGVLKKTNAFTDFFIPDLSLADNTTFNLGFHPEDSLFTLNVFSSFISYNDYVLENLTFNSFSEDQHFKIETGSKELKISNIALENFTMLLDAEKDSISFVSRWLNWDEDLYKGTIKAFCNITGNPGGKPKFTITIPKSEVVMGDSVWDINKSFVIVDSSFITVNNLGFSRNNQSFLINGEASGRSESKLYLVFKDFDLGNFNILSKTQNLKLEGVINGTGEVFNIYNDLSFASEFYIQDLGVNSEPVGNTKIITNYRQQKKVIDVFAESQRGRLKTIKIGGEYHPRSKAIDFDVELNKLKLDLFCPYTKGVFSKLSGLASGDFKVKGELNQPVVDGKVDLNKTSFVIDYLNTMYSFSDEIKIDKNKILFDEIKIFDQKSNTATLNGSISSNYFKDFVFDLDVNARNFLFLDNDYKISPSFYGKAFATGGIEIIGSPKDLTFNIDASTNPNTNFYIPLGSDEEITTYDFVSFVDHSFEIPKKRIIEKQSSPSGINLNFDLEVTQGAEVQVIFDSKMGDIIRARGYGDLKIRLDKYGNFVMFGDYNITEGDYLFTLQNIINKKFRIEEGSYISWNGEPTDANINIKAVYSTKANLNSLFPESVTNGQDFGSTNSYNKRIPVECQLLLTNKLANPSIDFGIYLPSADAATRSKVENTFNTKDELSKQFLSLLVVNSFMVDQSKLQTVDAQPGGTGAIGVTTSELLSNQISNWLSQISNDFDIGVNYRPDDGISSEELELALSTKILNDRVSISGNLEVGGQYKTATEQTKTSNIVGDFDVDVKISKSGKLRVKAFNKANENLFFESEYTQGIGIFYREEFDTFEELFGKYLSKLGVKDKTN